MEEREEETRRPKGRGEEKVGETKRSSGREENEDRK